MSGAGRGPADPRGRVRLLRAGLVVLAVVQGAVGALQLLAPRVFYDDFPAPATPWVSAYPPYNEHLVRDVGALTLAVVLVLAVAAWRPERRLVRTALVADLAFTVPHLALHVLDRGHLAGGEVAAQTATLLAVVAVPVLLLVVAARVPAGLPGTERPGVGSGRGVA